MSGATIVAPPVWTHPSPIWDSRGMFRQSMPTPPPTSRSLAGVAAPSVVPSRSFATASVLTESAAARAPSVPTFDSIISSVSEVGRKGCIPSGCGLRSGRESSCGSTRDSVVGRTLASSASSSAVVLRSASSMRELAPWPGHIQYNARDFARVKPSPLLLYYYDETAPNDVLLANDVRGGGDGGVLAMACGRGGKRTSLRSWTCSGVRDVDEFPIDGDEYSEPLTQKQRLSLSSCSTVEEETTTERSSTVVDDSSSSASSFSSSSSGSVLVEECHVGPLEEEERKCCGRRRDMSPPSVRSAPTITDRKNCPAFTPSLGGGRASVASLEQPSPGPARAPEPPRAISVHGQPAPITVTTVPTTTTTTTLLAPTIIRENSLAPRAVSPRAVSPGAVSPGAVSPGAVSPGAASTPILPPHTVLPPSSATATLLQPRSSPRAAASEIVAPPQDDENRRIDGSARLSSRQSASRSALLWRRSAEARRARGCCTASSSFSSLSSNCSCSECIGYHQHHTGKRSLVEDDHDDSRYSSRSSSGSTTVSTKGEELTAEVVGAKYSSTTSSERSLRDFGVGYIRKMYFDAATTPPRNTCSPQPGASSSYSVSYRNYPRIDYNVVVLPGGALRSNKRPMWC